MTSGEDWLMRPVLRGLCRFNELKDGSLTLHDVQLLNEALDVEAFNTNRAKE